MNRKIALLTIVITLLSIMPTALIINTASAQGSYSIPNVQHTIEVLFTGHIIIRDEINVQGSVANGFQMGIPSKYASSVLNVVAYDNNRQYPITLNTQLGGQSGFYGIQIDFQGNSPSAFTVQFVLSNNLITKSLNNYYLDFPVYPAFTTSAGQCKVAVSLPAEPSGFTIQKSDGNTNNTSIYKTNMAAYTNAPALASFYVEPELLQLVDIKSYTRTLSVSSSGAVSCQEDYSLKSVDTANIFYFMLCLPTDAKNVVTKSSAGAILTSDVLGTAGSSLLVNTSLPAYLATGQTVQISVEYNLPSFSVGSNKIMLFPTFNYVVDKASFIITMPEGATISTSDPSASVTTSGYEQKLTLTRNSVSYVDYSTPNYDYIQFDYSYSPFWSSYRPTIIVFGFSAVGCAGIILWTNKRKPEGEKKLAKAPVIVPKKEKPAETKTWTPKTLKTSPELIQKFIDDYELRRELIKEQEALEIKVQKGRIPRSQYKSQNNSLDSRIQGLTNTIHGAEGIFRYSSPELEHLIEKLEEAEAELDEASEQAKSIEMQRKSGEITIEQYKEDIADAEHAKENADSSINDILLQLREKMQ